MLHILEQHSTHSSSRNLLYIYNKFVIQSKHIIYGFKTDIYIYIYIFILYIYIYIYIIYTFIYIYIYVCVCVCVCVCVACIYIYVCMCVCVCVCVCIISLLTRKANSVIISNCISFLSFCLKRSVSTLKHLISSDLTHILRYYVCFSKATDF